MAKFVLTNPAISINSVDLEDHVASVTLSESYAEVPTTAFGDTAITRIAGLGDHSITLSFHEDFASSEVHQTIYPLLGGTTTVTVKPVNTTTTTDNPSFSMTVLVTEWPILNGAVGDLASADVTWPVSGAITKTTA
ncbi:MAG TPA: radical SAM protein [Acidimicrobiia bacterium]